MHVEIYRSDDDAGVIFLYLFIQISIVNDIKNCASDPAKASIYGFGRNQKRQFVMPFTTHHISEASKPPLQHKVQSGQHCRRI